MARTRKYNIYYQDDYTQDADVLADNQAMAESIETALETVENKADNNTIEISNIKNGTSIDSFEDVETALSEKEDSSNKTGVLNSSSTTAQYPHAKAVYDELVERDEEINQLWNDHPDILDNNALPSGTDLTLNGTGDLKMKVDVGGNSTQVQYSGKNMLEYTLQSLKTLNTVGTWNDNIYTQNDISYTINEDLSIKVNGIASTSSYLIISNSLNNLTNGTEYKLSGCPSNGNIQTYSLRMYKENSYSTQTGEDLIFTYSSQAPVRINIFENTTINNLIFKPMIRLSSISDTTYEPYVGGASPNPTYKQDINNVEGNVVVKGSSKNWFNESLLAQETNYNTYNNGIWTTYNQSAYNRSILYDVTGTTNLRNISKLPKLKPNTQYTIKFFNYTNNTGLNPSITLLYINNNGNIISDLNCGDLKVFTTPENCEYLDITRRNNTGTISFSHIMIVEGSYTSEQLQSYIPFAENTVTFPLSQGQKLMLGDTLEDDGIHHKKLQLVFDGTENWRQTTTLDNYIAYNLTLEKNAIKNGSNDTSTNEALCTIAKYNWYYNYLQENQFTLNNDTLRIVTDKVSTVEEFKTYLAQQYTNNTPVIVEYELETETIEAYTSAQQTAYNKLKEMQSYYDLTYVVGSSNNAQPILTVQAKKSLKVINDEISNINSRLTLLEE